MDLKDINTAATTVKGVTKRIKITFLTEVLKLLWQQKLKDRPYHRLPTERQKSFNITEDNFWAVVTCCMVDRYQIFCRISCVAANLYAATF